MNRTDFFDDATHAELLDRIAKLQPQAEPAWGTMNAAQMCAHCAEILEVMDGKPLVGTPWFVKLIGPLIRRMVLSRKPYPRGLQTHPQYRMPDSVQFEEERNRLVRAAEEFHALGSAEAARKKHPLFGSMTADEVGWLSYKHLNHHLTQFGL
jgi:hypothetical protein